MGDPFAGARLFSALSFIPFILMLSPILLLGLAIPYAVLRYQDGQGVERDPQVGLKCVLFFAFSVGILLMLTGLTVLLIDLLVDTRHESVMAYLKAFGTTMRSASALMMSGFMISFFHLILIAGFTNSFKWPATKRVFVGWRLAIHTVIFLSALTVLNFQLFQEEPRFEDMKPTFATLGVWFPSWLLHLSLLKGYRGLGRRQDAAPAPAVVS